MYRPTWPRSTGPWVFRSLPTVRSKVRLTNHYITTPHLHYFSRSWLWKIYQYPNWYVCVSVCLAVVLKESVSRDFRNAQVLYYSLALSPPTGVPQKLALYVSALCRVIWRRLRKSNSRRFYSLTSKVLAGLIVMFPDAWDLDVFADGGGSVDTILNGAFASNLMASGVSVVLASTNRWTSGVSPPSCWKKVRKVIKLLIIYEKDFPSFYYTFPSISAPIVLPK